MRRPGLMILLGAGLALAGCSENFRGPHPYNADLQAQVVPAVYCYSNLTHSPDCYDVPIEPEVRRLMGYYGPDPENRGFFGRRAF